PAVLSRESYRIVQESLTNALRYGADGTARLRLARDEASLHIDVDNPIPAAARPARRGSGIAGLVERADVLGGELTAGPVDGRWRVSAILPLTSQP
ncbi:MAG: ATP-binding protein, partial [Stackebrandtia sp.]